MARKKREHITKTTRFEVFKRDSFTCQYCGRSAPEALLELDHIEPVASGGGSDVLNLVTACKECNAGKSDRKLSDLAVVNRQVDQLKELEDRRQQLEMMVAWRRGLQELQDSATDAIVTRWNERTPGFTLTDNGRLGLQKLVARFGYGIVSESAEAALNQYLRFGPDGKVTGESWNKAFDTLPRICGYRKIEQERPHMAGVHLAIATAYARGLAAPYRGQMAELFERAVLAGIDSREISELLGRGFQSWKRVAAVLEEWIADARLPDIPQVPAESTR